MSSSSVKKETRYYLDIEMSKNDMERLAAIDGAECGSFEGFEIEDYQVGNFFIRLFVFPTSVDCWIGLELLDEDYSFMEDKPIDPKRVLNGLDTTYKIKTDLNDDGEIEFIISFKLTDEEKSVLDRIKVFLELEELVSKASSSRPIICPRCHQNLEVIGVEQTGPINYLFNETTLRFELDHSSLADRTFHCTNCFAVVDVDVSSNS